ncbi:MAG: hypothetical protein Q7J31_00170 [Syntrophales bacterium]|nr:hypothetical protein [Syntrophales bacterium]
MAGISIFSMIAIPFEIKPAFVSKITTVLQVLTVLFVLLFQCLPGNFDYAWIMLLYWLTALFTIISGLNYITKGLKLINNHTP